MKRNLGQKKISYCLKWLSLLSETLEENNDVIIRNCCTDTFKKEIYCQTQLWNFQKDNNWKLSYHCELTYLWPLVHHQSERNLNVLLANQRYIWKNFEYFILLHIICKALHVMDTITQACGTIGTYDNNLHHFYLWHFLLVSLFLSNRYSQLKINSKPLKLNY